MVSESSQKWVLFRILKNIPASWKLQKHVDLSLSLSLSLSLHIHTHTHTHIHVQIAPCSQSIQHYKDRKCGSVYGEWGRIAVLWRWIVFAFNAPLSVYWSVLNGFWSIHGVVFKTSEHLLNKESYFLVPLINIFSVNISLFHSLSIGLSVYLSLSIYIYIYIYVCVNRINICIWTKKYTHQWW